MPDSKPKHRLTLENKQGNSSETFSGISIGYRGLISLIFVTWNCKNFNYGKQRNFLCISLNHDIASDKCSTTIISLQSREYVCIVVTKSSSFTNISPNTEGITYKSDKTNHLCSHKPFPAASPIVWHEDIGDCSFQHPVGPLWNKLHVHLRSLDSFEQLKRDIKAFPIH